MPNIYLKKSNSRKLWILKNTFGRNLIFYIRHGPNSYRNHNYYNIPKNNYSKIPLILNPTCPLVLKLNKDENNNFENNLFDKIWNLKFFYEEKEFDYGPYNSNYKYEFIKNYYYGLNKHEKNNYNLLIIDFMSDIYYKPDALYQMFENELKNKEKKANENNKKEKENDEKNGKWSIKGFSIYLFVVIGLCVVKKIILL